MSTVICRQCKKRIDKEDAISISQKSYVCSIECKQAREHKEVESKKPPKVKIQKCKNCNNTFDETTGYFWAHRGWYCSEKCAKESLGEDEFYLGLMLDIVWDLCNKESNFLILRKQAETLHEVNKWPYSGMYMTVKYYVEILEKEWNREWGLGQIFDLKRYDEARLFYSQKYNVNKQFLGQEDEKVIIHVKNHTELNWGKKYIDSLSEL